MDKMARKHKYFKYDKAYSQRDRKIMKFVKKSLDKLNHTKSLY